VDTLTSLDRVYAIGGKELGLTIPVVGQTAAVEATGDRVLAQARTVSQTQLP
jgi:hypothetical protein